MNVLRRRDDRLKWLVLTSVSLLLAEGRTSQYIVVRDDVALVQVVHVHTSLSGRKVSHLASICSLGGYPASRSGLERRYSDEALGSGHCCAL